MTAANLPCDPDFRRGVAVQLGTPMGDFTVAPRLGVYPTTFVQCDSDADDALGPFLLVHCASASRQGRTWACDSLPRRGRFLRARCRLASEARGPNRSLPG